MRSTTRGSIRPASEYRASRITDITQLKHGERVELWLRSPRPKMLIIGTIDGSPWSSTENPKNPDMVRVAGRKTGSAKFEEKDYIFKNFDFYRA